MEKSARPQLVADDIDRFAEDLVRNPERADDLKRALKNRIALGSAHARHDHEAAESEDLWDNVPV